MCVWQHVLLVFDELRVIKLLGDVVFELVVVGSWSPTVQPTAEASGRHGAACGSSCCVKQERPTCVLWRVSLPLAYTRLSSLYVVYLGQLERL